MTGESRTPRRAAVLGSPIEHSRSPQLHLAAYRALGLDGWTYDRIECGATEFAEVIGAFGPEWVGVSVTMPDKFAALRCATECTPRAELVGSANTLVRTESGWLADNTDIDGVVGALGAASGHAIVLGSGGTAPAAVAGLAELGVDGITIAARGAGKAARLEELAERFGVPARHCDLDSDGLAAAAAQAGVLVSTIPAAAAAALTAVLARVPLVLDVVYDPWPTPLAHVVTAAGGRVVDGLQMLLHQAFTQVELFTGRPAPRAEMTCALTAAD